jgi:hypothetical protein
MLDQEVIPCNVVDDSCVVQLDRDHINKVVRMELLVGGAMTTLTLIEVIPSGEPPYYLSLSPLALNVEQAITKYSALAVRTV